MDKPVLPKPFASVILAVLALLVGGCASYNDATERMRTAWVAGDVAEAAQVAGQTAEAESRSVDAALLLLEAGATARGNREFDQSRQRFSQAENRIRDFEAEGEISLSAETAAIFVNPTVIPYRGRAYDTILLNTYQALNFMARGDLAGARVELRRAEQRQREAVERYADDLEDAIAAQEANSLKIQQGMRQQAANDETYDVAKAKEDARFQQQIEAYYREVGRYATYAPYVNPFTVLLDGIFHMTTSQSATDLERAALSLKRFKGMVIENSYIDSEELLLERRFQGRPLPPLTYVFFETGVGPTRRETRIDIPLFLFTNEVKYVGVAFPNLNFHGDYYAQLAVTSRDGRFETLSAGSVDSVVASEFQHEMPYLITRTLISAGTKALAQYAVKEAFAGSDNREVGQLLSIAVAAYSYAVNRADLRTWVTLPKAFAYCRLPRPSDGQLTLSPVGSEREVTVTLQPARVSVVYVKSISRRAPLIVHQFILQPETEHDVL